MQSKFHDNLLLSLQLRNCASIINFKVDVNVFCDLACITSSISQCIESSPSFEAFLMSNEEHAVILRATTELCCFDNSDGQKVCTVSQAMTHTSVLTIWITLILSLVGIAAM